MPEIKTVREILIQVNKLKRAWSRERIYHIEYKVRYYRDYKNNIINFKKITREELEQKYLDRPAYFNIFDAFPAGTKRCDITLLDELPEEVLTPEETANKVTYNKDVITILMLWSIIFILVLELIYEVFYG